MLKAEGYIEEAKNIQETLKTKLGEVNIIDLVIDCLSRMNEQSKPEKAKQSFYKLLDDRKDSEEDVTKAISRFRNNIAEWESISKSAVDGLFKVNLLLRMIDVSSQMENNLRTKVDFTIDNHNIFYNQVEMALKKLSGNVKVSKTSKVEDYSRSRRRTQSFSEDRRGDFRNSFNGSGDRRNLTQDGSNYR